MKDKTARALAIVGLVFMGIFVGALIATLVDRTLLYGSIGFVALGAGVVGILIFIALKADGRGFSVTQINNELEMEKIEREREAAQKEVDEQAKSEQAPSDSEPTQSSDRPNSADVEAKGEEA